jgi:hypothetical protein
VLVVRTSQSIFSRLLRVPVAAVDQVVELELQIFWVVQVLELVDKVQVSATSISSETTRNSSNYDK